MADVYQAVSKEYTVVVETAYKLIFDTRGGDAITAIDWSEHTAYRLGGALPVPVRDYWKFDGWYADAAYNDPITIEEIKAEKGTVTVYAKWLDDVAPVIELDGAEDVSTVQAGEVVVGESDVRVSDAAQGDDVTLTIEVKYQNGAFEALTEDYDFTRVGAYVIRYTAKDPSGNAAYVERTINVIDELPPEITLSGEIPESGFTGNKHLLEADEYRHYLDDLGEDVAEQWQEILVSAGDAAEMLAPVSAKAEEYKEALAELYSLRGRAKELHCEEEYNRAAILCERQTAVFRCYSGRYGQDSCCALATENPVPALKIALEKYHAAQAGSDESFLWETEILRTRNMAFDAMQNSVHIAEMFKKGLEH